MDNKYLLRKGSHLGVTDDYEFIGQITELTPDRISVRLDFPFEVTFSREIQDEDKGKYSFTVEIDGTYYASYEGYDNAMDLMMGLVYEEKILWDNSDRLADVVRDYRKMTNDSSDMTYKTKVLAELRAKHFPEITETVFTEKLINESYHLLTEIEGYDESEFDCSFKMESR